jgi:hypothetical protein
MTKIDRIYLKKEIYQYYKWKDAFNDCFQK